MPSAFPFGPGLLSRSVLLVLLGLLVVLIEPGWIDSDELLVLPGPVAGIHPTKQVILIKHIALKIKFTTFFAPQVRSRSAPLEYIEDLRLNIEGIMYFSQQFKKMNKIRIKINLGKMSLA